ncbi:MAG TPA: low specificity L-threonine aldolase [Candidatus Saccharimonadales bacterium]|jgi:threonine aldolase|nr:low specificity L-threonine aldolase [Candidatus Saccharimonadales bacterium]
METKLAPPAASIPEEQKPMRPVDLRSDTVTRPTAEMRRAMAEAEVGDDVYGEDPTVNRLEASACKIFEREAAVFVPTGTMGNQIAIKVHTHHGQEVICEERAHIINLESATLSAFSGVMPAPIHGEDGVMTWAQIKRRIAPKVYYRSQTGLIVLENTLNLAGGTIFPQSVADEVCDRAHEAGLPVHLDGARIFNAAAALGRSVAELSRKFDSVMFCFSKGLAAPVGSMLMGNMQFIERARAVRKAMGGGMRQAGVLAAACLVAMEKMPARLKEDHENARVLAEGLAQIPGIRIDAQKVVTNILVFDVSGTGMEAPVFNQKLAIKGVLANAIGPEQMRLVTHLDVSKEDCLRALKVIQALCAK